LTNKEGTRKADLLRRAEERLKKLNEVGSPLAGKDPIALVHELVVHQIELEMQNEELRRAHLETDELRKCFQELFDLAPMGYVILDENERIVCSNLAAAQIFDQERSLLVGRPLAEFFNAASARELTLFYRKVRGSEKEEQCELRLSEGLKGGAWLIANGIKVSGEDEGRVFVLISLTDITERKEIEASLIASEEKFYRVFHAVPAVIGIATVDEVRFVDVNDYCSEMLGYLPKEMIGRTAGGLDIWIDPESPAVIKGMMEGGNSVRNMEVRLRARNDGIRTVLLSADFIDLNGVPHMLIALRDITERKRAEEEIRRLNSVLREKAAKLDDANRELDAFNYAVAHDLLNYLNTIGCYCQLVRQSSGDKLGVECRDYIDVMLNSVQKMDSFITAMLEFSRLSYRELNRKDINLSAVALEIALRLKYMDSSRGIELRIAEGVTANGEPTLLRVVMENLLGNAFKFTEKREHAVIEFGITEKEGEKVYFVGDNGTGFDMSEADNIFIPFHRLHSISEHRGHGIGLATVERIIRRHGGRIWAEGKPDEGATFFFTLPETGASAGEAGLKT
jgi:PAS domain S-box-containing protein